MSSINRHSAIISFRDKNNNKLVQIEYYVYGTSAETQAKRMALIKARVWDLSYLLIK